MVANSRHRHRPVGEQFRGCRHESPRAIGRACRETGFFYVGRARHRAGDWWRRCSRCRAQFFAQPLAAEAAGGVLRTVGQSRLDQARQRGARSRQAPRYQGGLQHRPRACRPTIPKWWRESRSAASIAGPISPAFAPRGSPISTPAGASAARLHRAFAMDLGLAPDFFDGDVRPADGDVAHAPLSAAAGEPLGGPTRCRQAHRLRQRHPPRHRRGRRTDGAPSLRRMDQRAGRSPMPSSAISATA